MSDGDWGSHSAARRVAYVIGGLTIAAWIAAAHLPSGPRSEGQYHNAETDNGDARNWSPLPFDEKPEARKYAADCESPKDHEEADLCQQWRAAKAAEKAAAIADSQSYWNWVQAVVAIFTAVAAWASGKAAIAASTQAAIMQEQVRSWVQVKSVAVESAPIRGREKITITAAALIKNIGTTPATHVRVAFNPYLYVGAHTGVAEAATEARRLREWQYEPSNFALAPNEEQLARGVVTVDRVGEDDDVWFYQLYLDVIVTYAVRGKSQPADTIRMFHTLNLRIDLKEVEKPELPVLWPTEHVPQVMT